MYSLTHPSGALGITKSPLFIVFSTRPTPSELVKCHYFRKHCLLAICGSTWSREKYQAEWRPRSYQSVATFRPAPSKLPKCRDSSSSTPGPGGGDCHPRSYQSVAIYRLPFPAQVVTDNLGVTKVSLFIGFPSLPRWRLAPLESPKCRYLSSSPLCPGGGWDPRNYQSVAIHRLPAPARWRPTPWKSTKTDTLGISKASPFVVSPLPKW